MRFGAAFWTNRTDWPGLRDACLAVERAGWDSLWVDDHLLADEGDPADAKFEGWTTLAALATLTQRVRLGLLVAANTFRPPGLTAKLATTLDHLSGRSAVLGLGGGWFEREHDAFGIDFGGGFGERLDRLDESARAHPAPARRRARDPRGSLLLDARRRSASHARSRHGCRSSSAAPDRRRRCARRPPWRTCGTASARPTGSRRSARPFASGARRSAARSRRSNGPSRSTPSCATARRRLAGSGRTPPDGTGSRARSARTAAIVGSRSADRQPRSRPSSRATDGSASARSSSSSGRRSISRRSNGLGEVRGALGA